MMAMWGQELLELDIGQFACLGQPVHSMANLNMALVNEWCQIVMIYDFLWQYGNWDAN